MWVLPLGDTSARSRGATCGPLGSAIRLHALGPDFPSHRGGGGLSQRFGVP